MNIQHIWGQIEITMTEKGRIQKSKYSKGKADKANAEENGRLYTYNYPLHIRNSNHRPKIQN